MSGVLKREGKSNVKLKMRDVLCERDDKDANLGDLQREALSVI